MQANYDDLVRFIQDWSARTGAHITEITLTRENGKTIVLWVPPQVFTKASPPAENLGPPSPEQVCDEQRERPVSQCVIDILTTLDEVGRPLTTTRLLMEMGKKKRIWSQRSVSGYLSQMVDDGTLLSGDGKKPPGYRLPDWEDEKDEKSNPK